MSAYTTLRITRSQAMALVLDYLARASNDQLGALADYPLADRLFNCRVVPDGEPNDNDRLA